MAEARRAALWSPEALDDREKIWDYYVPVPAGTLRKRFSAKSPQWLR